MAILNSRDSRAARRRLDEIEKALSTVGTMEQIANHLPKEAAAARLTALREERNRLSQELRRYEALHGADQIEGDQDDLGVLPVLARVARGISQRELGERLGLFEQQIQRYERDRYAGIGLDRYQRVLAELGVELRPSLRQDWEAEPRRQEPPDADFSPTLLRAVKKRNWIGGENQSSAEFRKRLNHYLAEATELFGGASYNRQSAGYRADDLALQLWRARVIRVALGRARGLKGRFNIADTSWLADLAKLSVFPDGPERAIEFLRTRGVVVIVEPHLPQTLLDGAAFMLPDGIPVIGITVRYDRLDSFWFTLFHELGHVFLHLRIGSNHGFMDDLDSSSDAGAEREADAFARSKLIPDELWMIAPARFSDSADSVKLFAESVGIHPAIVAGRIRFERSNYKTLQKLLGSGEVKDALRNYSSEQI